MRLVQNQQGRCAGDRGLATRDLHRSHRCRVHRQGASAHRRKLSSAIQLVSEDRESVFRRRHQSEADGDRPCVVHGPRRRHQQPGSVEPSHRRGDRSRYHLRLVQDAGQRSQVRAVLPGGLAGHRRIDQDGLGLHRARGCDRRRSDRPIETDLASLTGWDPVQLDQLINAPTNHLTLALSD